MFMINVEQPPSGVPIGIDYNIFTNNNVEIGNS